MEVEILSKESIKPSSSSSFSSDHPKTHKLSLLDQFIPPVYSPLVIFYQANPNLSPSDTSESLKQSLSESLTRFYPLAGKVKDSLTVECNDEGACFIEAKTATSLSDYLSQRDLISTTNKLLPSELNWYHSAPGSHLLVVQVTQFSCGGLAIGLLVSHVIADGASLSCFLRDWAATSRKSTDGIIVPQFDAGSMFPQTVSFPLESTLMAFWSRFFRKARTAPRRFVFDAASIARLKEKATSSTLKNPTRVEVVSAFLCNSIMAAFRAKSSFLGDNNRKPTLVTQAVNMRRRANPPLSPCLMGNFPWLAIKLFENDHHQDNNLELASLVGQLREATDKIDADFVKSLQGEEGLTKLQEVVKGMNSTGSNSANGVDYIGFTSFCNFGAYDQLDLGWGQPIWGTYVTAEPRSDGPLINTVFLVDRKVDQGIEALVILDHEEMGFLDKDQQLLAFASLDSSPYKTMT